MQLSWKDTLDSAYTPIHIMPIPLSATIIYIREGEDITRRFNQGNFSYLYQEFTQHSLVLKECAERG